MYKLLTESEIRQLVKKGARTQKISALHKSLAEHTNRVLGSLPNKHQENVIDYTSGSSSLNAHLFRHKKPTEYLDKIRSLDKVMNVGKLPHDVVVHSGVKWNPAAHMEEKHITHPDKHPIKVVLPAYTSTSLSKGIANDFTKSEKDMPHSRRGSLIWRRHYNRPNISHYNVKTGKTQSTTLTDEELAGHHDLMSENERLHKDYAESGYKKEKLEPIYEHRQKMAKFMEPIMARVGKTNNPKENPGYGAISHYDAENVAGPLTYHKHIISIHVPAGHPAIYTQPVSRYKKEKELVLKRGTKLHIHPVPEIHEKSQTVFWHAKVVK